MKWYTYLLCFILVVVGSICGIQLYKEVKAESYVNGSIDISNKFSQEAFNYTSTSLVFYHDDYDTTETYSFSKDLLKIDNFNGETKKYEITLNDYVLTNCDIKAGSVFATINMDFYNTDGNIVCNSTMQLSVKFLSGKTQLTIVTNGQENASFLEQYFRDNGIRLKIMEIL